MMSNESLFRVQPSSFSARVELAPGVWVGRADLHFHFARSGGPGGQNVNKLNTKAELRVRPELLHGLSEKALARLRTAHANRITGAGDLLLVAESERTQEANRAQCLARLAQIVAQVRPEPKVRRKTRPSASSRERRLETKKRHGEKKRRRLRGLSPE
jgi:ribosome-associated protein